MEFLIVVVLVWSVMIAIACHVAQEKGRGTGEAITLTLFLGPLGILIVAVLPTLQKATPKAVVASDEDRAEAIRRYHEKLAVESEKEQQAFRDQDQARKAAAAKRRDEKREFYLAKGITPGPLAWIEAFSVDSLAWFKGSSDLMQMFVLAICVSIPALVVALMIFRR